jgi:oxygen-independent coproporphyrinogen III oxidase
VVSGGGPPRGGEEVVSPEAARLERVWLGLRTREGLSLDELDAPGRARAADWAGRGWAVVDEDRVRLTSHGWLLLDRLAVELA